MKDTRVVAVKQEKIDTVAEIKEAYAKSASIVFAEYKGLPVEDMFRLRRSLREKAVTLRVLKNTLVRRALEESGVKGTEQYLKGPIAVAFSPDEVSGPKVIAKFAKEIDDLKLAKKLIIRGGVIVEHGEGKSISAKEVGELAALPSREEVFAKLLALINTPATMLLRLIQEPGARVARLIKISTENK